MSENPTRRIYYLAAIAIVAIVLISAVATVRPINVQTGSSQAQEKTIQVTGQSTVTAAPDEAILSLAVQTQSTSATEASNENSAIMSQVYGALANAGVGNDSIQTISYSLQPVYKNPDQTPSTNLAGYVARNEIQVTLTDLRSVGKVLDTAVSAGVNVVDGITFTLSSSALSRLQKQAAQLAIQDADTQAKSIAATLGVTLVGPISISPGFTYQPLNERMAAASVTTPIQAGTLQVSATVQVTFEFT